MEIKTCKKCGCTLPSNTKKKLCKSCQLRKNEKIKKGAGIATVIVAAIGSVIGYKSLKDRLK